MDAKGLITCLHIFFYDTTKDILFSQEMGSSKNVHTGNTFFYLTKAYFSRFCVLGFFFFFFLTLSHRHDVPNVNSLPSTRADMTLRTSSPQRQFGKKGARGVLYYYAGRLERVKVWRNTYEWLLDIEP